MRVWEGFSQDYLCPITQSSITSLSQALNPVFSLGHSLWSLRIYTQNSRSHQNCSKDYFLLYETQILLCNTWPSSDPGLLIFFSGSLMRKWVTIHFQGFLPTVSNHPISSAWAKIETIEWELVNLWTSLGEIKQVTIDLWTDLCRTSDSLLVNNLITAKKGGKGQDGIQEMYQPDAMCGPCFDHDDKKNWKKVMFETLGTF